MNGETIISASIAHNSQLLTGHTSKNHVYVWSIPQLENIASTVTSDQIREISFLGFDCKRILGIGVGFVKIFTLNNKRELKPTLSLTCRLNLCLHSWLSNKECLCCDINRGLFTIDFKSNEIKPIRIENTLVSFGTVMIPE